MKRVIWEELPHCDLEVGEVYCRGTSGRGTQNEVLHRLIPGVSNSGGIRSVGGWRGSGACVLFSTGKEEDWPDSWAGGAGSYFYYGDNRVVGRDLLNTPKRGNSLLSRAFRNAADGIESRLLVPVFLFFRMLEGSRGDVAFEGLGVPDIAADDGGLRVTTQGQGEKSFENYVAQFLMLDDRIIGRGWINLLLLDPKEAKKSDKCPGEFSKWLGGMEPKRLKLSQRPNPL